MSDLIDRQASQKNDSNTLEALDCVSRQAAIDAVRSYMEDHLDVYDSDWHADGIAYEIKRLPSAQLEIIRCKDCKYFEYDHLYIVRDIPVIGHLVCNKWGDGCRTDENGFCFMAERRTDGRSNQ